MFPYGEQYTSQIGLHKTCSLILIYINHKGNCSPERQFTSLLNNKFLDWSKLKALADAKINMTEKLKFVLGRVENILGKGENAGYQHFLLFSCFQQASWSGSSKVGCVVKG